jgi:hypothetical protein
MHEAALALLCVTVLSWLRVHRTWGAYTLGLYILTAAQCFWWHRRLKNQSRKKRKSEELTKDKTGNMEYCLGGEGNTKRNSCLKYALSTLILLSPTHTFYHTPTKLVILSSSNMWILLSLLIRRPSRRRRPLLGYFSVLHIPFRYDGFLCFIPIQSDSWHKSNVCLLHLASFQVTLDMFIFPLAYHLIEMIVVLDYHPLS